MSENGDNDLSFLEMVAELPRARGGEKNPVLAKALQKIAETPIPEGQKEIFFKVMLPNKTSKQMISLLYEDVKRINAEHKDFQLAISNRQKIAFVIKERASKLLEKDVKTAVTS